METITSVIASAIVSTKKVGKIELNDVIEYLQ